jgi:hypothetical protein
MQMLKMVLDKCDLRLNEKKTSIVDARKESFDFLGFAFQIRASHRSRKLYPHVEPSKRSVKRVKTKVKMLTHRRRSPVPLTWLIAELNDVIRGWAAYFHYGNSSNVMGKVRWFTEERVRKHLRVRYKVRTRTRGYNRFSMHFLYQDLGLYKIPTHAKWKQVQAL